MSNVHRRNAKSEFEMAVLIPGCPPTMVASRNCITKLEFKVGQSSVTELIKFGDENHVRVGIIGHLPCIKVIESHLPIYQHMTKFNHRLPRYKHARSAIRKTSR